MALYLGDAGWDQSDFFVDFIWVDFILVLKVLLKDSLSAIDLVGLIGIGL